MIFDSGFSPMSLWLELVSSHNVLSSPLGTSMWLDDFNRFLNLNIRCFDPSAQLSDTDHETLAILAQYNFSRHKIESRNFDVLGDLYLRRVSPIYKSIQAQAEMKDVRFLFDTEPISTFRPWTNRVNLGSNFYKRTSERIKIPFYTFNHENAHVALFKAYYSNIAINDSELATLYILIEWFCISLDLVLAFDLLATNSIHCMNELESITMAAKVHDQTFFSNRCRDWFSVERTASAFREFFFGEKGDTNISQMISQQTIEEHWSYTREHLVPSTRAIETNVSADDAKNLLEHLRKASFSNLLHSIAKSVYAG